MKHPLFPSLFAATALLACTATKAPTDGPQLAISTAPLSFPGITDVVWTVTVTTNNGANTVWTKTIRSSNTGDGKGAATWIGPCDADAGLNRVTLTLDAIEGTGGADLGDYVNPTPIWKDVTCGENQDTLVAFNVVVARNARQGFFDIAVNFEDVFCSAKLDCVGDDDLPLKLLFDGPDRGPTIVVAWACTSGANEASYLHMDDLVFACSDGTTVHHDPGAGPGNVGAGPSPYLFQRAVYTTREDLAPYAKCAWTHAFGVDLDAIRAKTPAIDCSLTGRATVSPEPWPLGFSRPDTAWPVITWNVKVIDDGALSCTRHGLDNPQSGVTTAYTSLAGSEHFDHSLTCAPGLPIAKSFSCAGDNPYPGGVAGMAMVDATHVTVRIGDATSAPLALPAGATLEGCCMDDCCQAP